MSDAMIHLQSGGEYRYIYEIVRTYLAQHFTNLPEFDVFYNAKGLTHSENQQHLIVTDGLVVVQIHAEGYDDAIGLLLIGDQVELDAVSSSALPELRAMYGYHE